MPTSLECRLLCASASAYGIQSAGTIVKVFYPVFPPDRNAGDVVAWLSGAPG